MAQEPFVFRKVLYLVEATGRRAANLDELLRAVSVVDPRSIGYHMHRDFLSHKFIHSEYPNDFAQWTARVIGDEMLAERLANLVVFRYHSLEALRAELARLIADHLFEHVEAALSRAPRGREFFFASARSVIMDCGHSASDLNELVAGLSKVPSSSIYYHLFETRFAGVYRRNDFAEWIDTSLGRGELARRVADIDPYMFSLEEARRKIVALCAVEASPEERP